MPKLYFRYGTMCSSKSANLLMVAHNYTRQGKNVYVIKPAIDTRKSSVSSRAGLDREADLLCDSDTNISSFIPTAVDAILVDEAQFLTVKQVDQLREIATYCAPVLCYGLRTDYTTHLFPGSKRLMEIADSIEEVKTTCQFCSRKAVVNLRYSINEKGQCMVIRESEVGEGVVDIGAENKYMSACWKCWSEKKPW